MRPTLLVSSLLLAAAPAAAASIATEPVSFQVTNPSQPLQTWTVRGTLYTSATNPSCTNTVVLLLHGLSYGRWAWDFPIDTNTYSFARTLAANGFPALAIDELGYGNSDHPNGETLTVQAYGSITSQIVSALRAGRYSASTALRFQRVVLFGHSAGTEMSELAAGTSGNVDALIASAYDHFPSTGILLSVITEDTPAATLYPYIYFDSTPSQRAADMYNLSYADPAIVSEDTQLANLTPSGEILSISSQPSRTVLPDIHVPVLLILAEDDALFPPSLLGVSYANAELALFLGTADKTAYVVPQAGHSFMLHPNAPQTQQVVTSWLTARFLACAP